MAQPPVTNTVASQIWRRSNAAAGAQCFRLLCSTTIPHTPHQPKQQASTSPSHTPSSKHLSARSHRTSVGLLLHARPPQRIALHTMAQPAAPQPTQEWADTVACVLQLVVGTCPDASAPAELCSLLQASAAIRAALQQATGHCSVQGLSTDACAAFLAGWLPQHAGLVKRLHISGSPESEQHMAALALQLCAAAHRPLHLESFGCEHLQLPAVLQALRPTGVRRLVVGTDNVFGGKFECSQQMLDALAQLTGVVEVQACMADTSMSAQLGAALGRLPRLQRLQLGRAGPSVLPELPASLVAVAAVLNAPAAAGAVHVDMGQLTALTVLSLSMKGQCVLWRESVLPPALQHLKLYNVAHEALQLPQSLTEVRINHRHVRAGLDIHGLGILQSLAAVPRLQAVDLHVHGGTPQLQQAAAALGAATQLTKLELECAQGVDSGVMWCQQLALLTGLQHLQVIRAGASSQDVCRLTALRSLTHLRLVGVGVDDAAVVALACCLRGLKELRIQQCALSSCIMFPALGLLTGLEVLWVSSSHARVSDVELGYLTELTRLTHLCLSRGPACSDAAVARPAGVRRIFF